MTKKIKLKISARLLKKRARRGQGNMAKQCRFCLHPDQEQTVDYKNAPLLRGFLTERGKILPSRISGLCCKHQRHLSKEIRKSRTIALLPYIAQYY
ncbi:MAG TPA: 30S ribosomal protein S18 [Candidatus Bathyarchaeia archaeon]|nr:30S ribosomal protein S18 [Candidatus Bathyarchaeia archaeon]